MQTDFLPNMNLPYMAVITGYPGASPQKVEEAVTTPIENSIAVINGVKRVRSQSSENAGTVFLEFENDTDMDSVMVKVSSALDQVDLPEDAMKPVVLEVSMDMLPVMYVGVDCKGKSGSELSRYIEDEIVPVIKRQDGVASVQLSGMIEESVEISLNSKKVDSLNEKIKDEALSQLSEAESQLSSAEGAIANGKSQLAQQKKNRAKRKDSRPRKKRFLEISVISRTRPPIKSKTSHRSPQKIPSYLSRRAELRTGGAGAAFAACLYFTT